ncbi:MAG TPA: hypothetical protein VF532_11275 [Candidatus Angelobacter sp.]
MDAHAGIAVMSAQDRKTSEVEDILQEAFYKLAEANRLPDVNVSTSGLLFGIARNRSTDLEMPV